MTKLLPITIFGILFAFISHKYSNHDPIEWKYGRKDRLFYTIMAIGLIFFAGLRTTYNDTYTYVHMYGGIEKGENVFKGIKWFALGDNPGFIFVQRIMANCGVIQQTFLLLFSAFTVGVPLWFIKKYSCNLWLSVLLFITFAGYMFTMAAIKQCTAMAICMIATDRFIGKKYVRGVILVLIASLFHPYAVMYLVVPLLFFRPWSEYTFVMLLVFGLAGVGMQSLLGTLLNVTDMMGEEYDAASFTGEGVNPLRLLVTAVPAILSVMTTKQISADEDRAQYATVNLSMLNAEIMFVALFGTANYFARLANYFLPFQTVAIPWLLKHYEKKERTNITLIAVLCYVMFYIYSFAINEHFDTAFYKTTIWKYLDKLFEFPF